MVRPTVGRIGEGILDSLLPVPLHGNQDTRIPVPALLTLFCSTPFHSLYSIHFIHSIPFRPLDFIPFDEHILCARQCARSQRKKTHPVPALRGCISHRWDANNIVSLDFGPHQGQQGGWTDTGLGIDSNPGSITNKGNPAALWP